MTADMLSAYYSRGCDSKELFKNYEISTVSSYEKNLNKYDVIHFDVQWCMMDAEDTDHVVDYINEGILQELREAYGQIIPDAVRTAYGAMSYIKAATGNKFVVIIDEWDVLIRDEAQNHTLQEAYIDFLRGMFKGTEPSRYIALAYLTGILPIKKLKRSQRSTILKSLPCSMQDGWLLTSGLQKKKSTDCVNNTDAVMNR